MRHSLKYRVALAAALVVTLILGVRVLASQYYAYASLRQLLETEQARQTDLVAQHLDDKFDSRIHLLRRLARQLEPMLDQPPATLRVFASGMVDTPEDFNAVFLAWPDGDVAFSTAVPQERRLQVKDRDYFRALEAGASVATSDLLYGRMSSAPGMVLAVPLRAPDGTLRAVVGGALNLAEDNFLHELRDGRLGSGGIYCLVSSGQNPRYAMHAEPARIMLPAAQGTADACGLATPAAKPWEFLRPARPVVTRRSLDLNGWTVVSVLPAEQAFLPLIDVRHKWLLIGLLTLAGAAGLMWLMVRRLLKPLEDFHRAVDAVALNADALNQLPTQRRDEIGQLASAFAGVVRQLHERESALKAAKDLAAESEKRIEAIANHVPDFISLVDAKERYVFVNQAYARHFGLPVQQIVGLKLRELWGTPTYLAVRPHLEQAFAGRAVTYTQESPDGTECLEVSCQPAWDDARDTVVGLYMFARNVTAERQALRSLEAQTVSDHLTGLLNRKGFDRCLAEAMNPGEGPDQSIALMLVDLDDFKHINDSHGHAVGDELLAGFGRRLSACVREGDAVARIGGDEFAIVLRNAIAPADLERIAQDIVQGSLQAHRIAGRALMATASVGAAVHLAGDGQTASELFMRADMALYEAKRRGKARYALQVVHDRA
ncbi:sensor domain-containing diguanylate cyclase [Cupriavidus sp. USMAA2-4]|uniref:diguanylate cyclase domain-containing protein n=1 Tax=Cupriavidus sp. USMAA2-4 TaxID=876364 RepID=UPI0008A6E70D|nr:diguanylate cyclase [Cupriavidus sp. USMAA2-4]AOY93438.1 sensor domain-containing diguanylate cyclase [Cupriavidus sp. USMAA2-4]